MQTKLKSPRPPLTQSQESAPPVGSTDFKEIRALAASLNKLHRQIADNYAPIVQDILRNRTCDQKQIEHVLDHLLDCACIPEGLVLFRALCRYYFPIDPAATATYIYAYRELWDSDDLKEEDTE